MNSLSHAENHSVTLRRCFVTSMILVAAVVGVIAYTVLDQTERATGIQTYESVAASALEQARGIAQRKQQGGQVLSTVLKFAFPDAAQWPLEVGLPGYTAIANTVAQLSSTSGHGFTIIVEPDDVPAFEEHAEQLYRDLDYPETAGVSDFGFGIYGMDENGERFHDTSGNTTYASDYKLLMPFFQHSNTFRKPNLLLMNLHNAEFRGQYMDSIIDCAKDAEAAAAAAPTTEPTNIYAEDPGQICGVVTDFTEIFIRPGPAAVFFQPIFPALNPTSVVGFIGTSIHWEEVLTNVVPDFVDGLDCVVSQGTESYTYQIQKGVPQLIGKGDLHDVKYTHRGHSIILNDESDKGAAAASKSYTLTLYPTDKFLDHFYTSDPLAITLSFVALILLCTGIFFLYDYFMKYQSKQRKLILEMKRRFVRFISHEIRTPLNTVCMGLQLLQAELESTEDHPTPDSSEDIENQQGDKGNKQPKLEQANQDALLPIATASSPPPFTALTTSIPYWLDLTGDILENSQAAVSVLNDLLNYDKIESGTFTLELGTVDIWNLVRKTVSEFTISARNRHVRLTFELIQPELTSTQEQEQQQQSPTQNNRKSLTYDEEEARSSDNNNNDDNSASTTPPLDLEQLHVLGDDIRLTQVFRNLLSNALKFVPEETGTITVTARFKPDGLPKVQPLPKAKGTTANGRNKAPPHTGILVTSPSRRKAGSAEIRVQDNGVGLTEEQLGRLFAEGVQFDANKLQAGGGSGLGLCITKEIVLQHQGSIEAFSEGRGCGVTFVVEIPLYWYDHDQAGDGEEFQGPVEGKGAGTAHDSTTTTTGSLSTGSDPPPKHHILVVDDAISNTKMLVRLLERAGHTCVVAHNGVEAIEAFKANREAAANSDARLFDTILMDSEMPELNGPDATKQLRQMGCQALIVGVTGNVLAEDVAIFKSSGADYVLPKPINMGAINVCWAKSHRLNVQNYDSVSHEEHS